MWMAVVTLRDVVVADAQGTWTVGDGLVPSRNPDGAGMSGSGDHKGRPYGSLRFAGLRICSMVVSTPGPGLRTAGNGTVGDGLVPSRSRTERTCPARGRPRALAGALGRSSRRWSI